MTSRTVFLDVDGTILDHGRSIAPSTITAIRGARAAGHLVFLSTGRSAADIHPDVRALGLDGAITNGGAYARVGAELVAAHPMPLAAVTRMTDYFLEHGISYFLQSDDGVFADAGVRSRMTQMIRAWGNKVDPQFMPRFRDLGEADLAQIAKSVFVSDATGTVAQVQAELGKHYHVVPGSMPLPGGSNGEVSLRGVTKGAAVLAVLAHLGRSADDAIGIGDSWNDAEMFDVCGVGIAMGNADPELQERADEVTTSVAHDGIHNAFVKHGLIAA
ncbi:Cof-type HAD-IIB family hydrolase [Microbacterium sp. BWT-B31]|uniref:Cof-type HAD-IIB family hydrolase n=1 Tax=Microbacterium sp. BWT-B31 TaxID=3232072 RepID=UPI0035294CC5